MKCHLPVLLALLSSLSLTTASRAADLGDPAAPLKIAEWVKGGPVDLAASKGRKIVVVEFWATWCGPCLTSIPHLTELQKKFKDRDVVFVGVTDEKPSVVKPFVAKQAEKMEYAVAIDDNGQTTKGYMEAYGINGIPHAFVVDKEGRVVWQGHPMAELEQTLDQLVAGKYDLGVARKRSETMGKLEEFFAIAADDSQKEKADALAKELEALEKELGGIVNGRPFDAEAIRQQARFSKAMRALQKTVVSGADDAAVKAAAEKARGFIPPGFNLDEFLVTMRVHAAFQQYMEAAIANDADKTKALGEKLARTDCKDPEILNQIAWTLLTEESLKNRDLVLATQIAKAARDASQGKDSNVLDTYARALFDSGKVEEAIAQQKLAVELCTDEENLKGMKATLESYQKKAAAK